MDFVIELIDVRKQLGTRNVLDGVYLNVHRGETLVIIGRSGTGKSILLRHIVGLMAPDSGEVLVNGVDVSQADHKTLLKVRSKMGVLFQSGALIHWLTVAQNVALPLRELGGYTEEDIKHLVQEKLAMVEMSGSGDLQPDQISGGMQKRAALARAIIRNPEIILYDEPTSGLDPVIAHAIDQLIVSIQRKMGVTSVVVTHDMNSAYFIADRIAMLYEGKIIQVGTPEEIRNSSNPIVRQFVQGGTIGPQVK